MCDFISWIGKNNETVFLTADDIYKTKAGRDLQKHSRNNRDLIGHGAIRHYYNFTSGVEKECTDFSTPNNFPAEIVKAIKASKFKGLGTPEGLLLPSVYKKYKKIQQPTLAEFEKMRQGAYTEYEKKCNVAFWGLFKVKKNRRKCWR